MDVKEMAGEDLPFNLFQEKIWKAKIKMVKSMNLAIDGLLIFIKRNIIEDQAKRLYK